MMRSCCKILLDMANSIKKFRVDYLSDLSKSYDNLILQKQVIHDTPRYNWQFDPDSTVNDPPVISDEMCELIGTTNEKICESEFIEPHDSYYARFVIEYMKKNHFTLSDNAVFPETITMLNKYESLFCVLTDVGVKKKFALAIKTTIERDETTAYVLIKMLDEETDETAVRKLYNRVCRLEKKEKKAAQDALTFSTPGQTCRGKIGGTKRIQHPVTKKWVWEHTDQCMIGDLVRYDNGGTVGKRGWLYEIVAENHNEPDCYNDEVHYTYKLRPVFSGWLHTDQRKPPQVHHASPETIFLVDIMDLARSVSEMQRLLQHTLELKSGGREKVLTDEG